MTRHPPSLGKGVPRAHVPEPPESCKWDRTLPATSRNLPQNDAGTRGNKWHNAGTNRSADVHASLDGENNFAGSGCHPAGDETAEYGTAAVASASYHGTEAASTPLFVSADLLNSPLVRRGAASLSEAATALRRITVSERNGLRREPRSPDRARSVARRRTLGGKAIMLPPEMCQHFTEGQRAVLNVIADAIRRHGRCDMPIDRIAAIAGVCRRMVSLTTAKAAKLGFLSIQFRRRRDMPDRSFPNVLRIKCAAWLTWLKKSKAAPLAVTVCKALLRTGRQIITTAVSVTGRPQDRSGSGAGGGAVPYARRC